MMIELSKVALVLMAAGIISGAVVSNAPEALPFLWLLKAATVSFTGVAGLLMHPTAKVPAVLGPPRA